MTKIKKPQNFWRHHVLSFNANDLSGAAYCRQNNLVYSQFLYWQSKFSKNEYAAKDSTPISNFVPVNLPVLNNNALDDKARAVLCIVEFAQGYRLVIHNMGYLKILPNILSVASSRKSTVIPMSIQQLSR
jgi:hypothetical protein